MVEEWRFLDTGLHDSFYNMALDEAIATARVLEMVKVAHPDFRDWLIEEAMKMGWLPRTWAEKSFTA